MFDASDPPTTADALAALVRRLRPDWRDAERFYEARSEIAAGIMRISRRLGWREAQPLHRAPLPLRTAAPARRAGPHTPPAPSPRPSPAPVPLPAPAPVQRRPRARLRRHRYPLPPAAATPWLL
jgi:hypothetical protein